MNSTGSNRITMTTMAIVPMCFLAPQTAPATAPYGPPAAAPFAAPAMALPVLMAPWMVWAMPAVCSRLPRSLSRSANSALLPIAGGKESLRECLETGDHLRRKGAARAAAEHGHGLVMGAREFIGPGGTQGIIGVSQGHHMDIGGDVLALQAVRESTAVPPLVVVQADITENTVIGVLPKIPIRTQQPDAQRGVLLQDPPLLQRQLPALLEDGPGQALLPNVVEAGEVDDPPDLLLCHGGDDLLLTESRQEPV